MRLYWLTGWSQKYHKNGTDQTYTIKQLNKLKLNNNFVNIHRLLMYYVWKNNAANITFSFLYILFCDVIHDLLLQAQGLYSQLVPTLALCGILV
jgi:hypothetical protein